MDCYTIPSCDHKFVLRVAIKVVTPVDLVIKGYDANHHDSTYFKRDLDFFSGTKEFEIPMPISPTKLKVCAYDKKTKSGKGIKIVYVKCDPIVQKTPPFNSPDDWEFYEFMQKFAKECGYSNHGIYYSKNKKFEIKLSDQILNDDGSVSSTPARTFRPYGEIEVSKRKFDKMTVFMRVMILLHERMHIRANTRDEEKSDQYAVTTYRGFNYPKTEALNSFKNVFKPLNEKHEQALIQRTDKLTNYLKFN